jgi:hypothetical protein
LDSRLDAIVEVELGKDAGDVVGDGVGADVEFVGDVVIAFAAREPGEDFKFAGGQGGPDRVGRVITSVAIGMPRSRMRCSSLPAICEEITDSPAAVALTAATIVWGSALFRM